MAEAVLFNIAEDILKNLGSRALDEVASAWGFKARLEKLKNTINTIKDVLLDAEKRQLESRAVRGWLERLKDAVYTADDLFDEFATVASQTSHKKVNGGKKFSKQVQIFFSHSNKMAVAFSISKKIRRIRQELDDIVKDGNEFAFVQRPYEEQGVIRKLRDETYSFVDAQQVIGRDYDKKAILDILLAPTSHDQQHVHVVPIVGIGGLGKTTVAQLIYTDDKVETHFELRLWVCVSENFDIKEIVKKILMSATNTEPQNLELDQLQKQLQAQIIGRKYFLVLDDMWNENREQWLKLSALLNIGREGSKILVTTRSWEVASIMGTLTPYALDGLSEGYSWSLFRKKAFAPGQENKNPELLKIGKEIVKKCAHVPLAISTIGSLLFGKDESKWLNFKDKSLVQICERGNNIMPILKLSYHHLWSPLKNCFAYCALFPKDYEFNKETLINLWMAEGFVIPTYDSQSLEEVGEEYFLTLLQRSFFQDITEDRWGNIRTCKMHDLMHDLAQEVAGIECKLAKSGEVDFNDRIRHLSFDYQLTSSRRIPRSMLNLKLLRTFFLPQQIEDGSFFSKSITQQLLSSFRCLRVLDLHNIGVDILPSPIGKLIHLRYLNLSGTPIEALPDSITELHNLQTLDLNACSKLRKLPADIGKLRSLRSLDVGDCLFLTSIPSGIGELTSLHKLTSFLVDNTHLTASKGKDVSAQLRDLKKLNNLKGVLEIRVTGELKDPVNQAKEANLSSKVGLTRLYIELDRWSLPEVGNEHNEHDEAVLEGLKPHPNLKKFKIYNYRGKKLPSWAVMDNLYTSLPNLVELKLEDCRRCRQLPIFDKLPFLKRLTLVCLERVEHMDNNPCEIPPSNEETLFFPSLEELTLMYMSNLKGWWKEAQEVVSHYPNEWQQYRSRKSFSNLSKLHIERCPMLNSLPLCPNVEELTLVEINSTLSVLKMASNLAVTTGTTSSASLRSRSKLKYVHIDNVEDLISHPKECLHHLSSLNIQDSKLLSTSRLGEVFRSSSSLRCLEFSFCHRLRCISGSLGHLTTLEKLVIGNCKELDLLENENVEDDGMPWKAFNNLGSLLFQSIPKLVTLPSGLQYLKNLRSLEMAFNEELKELPGWMSSFSSLEQMYLTHCPKLTSLPEGFRELSGLKILQIVECPALTKRCQGPGGKDWPKIQHIPVVIVAEEPWERID